MNFKENERMHFNENKKMNPKKSENKPWWKSTVKKTRENAHSKK